MKTVQEHNDAVKCREDDVAWRIEGAIIQLGTMYELDVGAGGEAASLTTLAHWWDAHGFYTNYRPFDHAHAALVHARRDGRIAALLALGVAVSPLVDMAWTTPQCGDRRARRPRPASALEVALFHQP